MICKKLPEEWCVKNDKSELFKKTVLQYLEDNYNNGEILKDSFLKWNYPYVGRDIGSNNNGCLGTDISSDFNEEISLTQFIRLTGYGIVSADYGVY